jgi:hypothetical protein
MGTRNQDAQEEFAPIAEVIVEGVKPLQSEFPFIFPDGLRLAAGLNPFLGAVPFYWRWAVVEELVFRLAHIVAVLPEGHGAVNGHVLAVSWGFGAAQGRRCGPIVPPGWGMKDEG